MGPPLEDSVRAVRVVLDTNTVVSTLVFTRGRLGWLRDLWTSGRIVPLVSRATARELIDALAYPKFRLNEEDIEVLLGAYLPFAETVQVADQSIPAVPQCRDPDDQKFLDLAAIGAADVLVTGDRAILDLAAVSTFTIETAADFKKRFPDWIH